MSAGFEAELVKEYQAIRTTLSGIDTTVRDLTTRCRLIEQIAEHMRIDIGPDRLSPDDPAAVVAKSSKSAADEPATHDAQSALELDTKADKAADQKPKTKTKTGAGAKGTKAGADDADAADATDDADGADDTDDDALAVASETADVGITEQRVRAMIRYLRSHGPSDTAQLSERLTVLGLTDKKGSAKATSNAIRNSGGRIISKLGSGSPYALGKGVT